MEKDWITFTQVQNKKNNKTKTLHLKNTKVEKKEKKWKERDMKKARGEKGKRVSLPKKNFTKTRSQFNIRNIPQME